MQQPVLALLRLFNECCAVARAAGFPLRDQFIEACKTNYYVAGSPVEASMLRDVERGAPTEGEHVLGDMVARASGFGVETPVLDLARRHVAAYEIARATAVES